MPDHDPASSKIEQESGFRIKSRMTAIEFFGWYGMVAILTSFALISFGYVDAHSIVYQTLNFTGAVGLATNAWVDRDRPAGTLNMIYALIAIISLVKIIYGN